MCVTSPPYFGLRNYGIKDTKWPKIKFIRMIGTPEYEVDEWIGSLGNEPDPILYTAHIVYIARLLKTVLKHEGTFWLNLGDCYVGGGRGCSSPKQKSNRGTINMPDSVVPLGYNQKNLFGIPWMVAFALQADGWYLRQDIIWNKPNAMPESVKDRCTKSHEYIFMFSKNKNYYYDADAIKETCVNGDPNSPRGSKGCDTLNSGLRKQDAVGNRQYTGFNDRYFNGEKREFRNKRSVWNVTTKPIREAHFATFPPDLVETCILAGCPKDGIIIDPFMGSGTTGMVAKKLSRNYTGIDIQPEYIEIQNKRIS